MPLDTRDALLSALDAGLFSQSRGAADAIRLGWQIKYHRGEVPSASLLRTYSVRLTRLRSRSSAHAAQLAQSVSELVEQLQFHPTGSVDFVQVQGNAEHMFDVFVHEDGSLLSCLRVVSQLDVSADRWRELWNEEA